MCIRDRIYTDYPAGCVISVICMFTGLLQVPAFYYLFGKKVNDLLRRIPDNVCLFIFLASFVGFVTKQILLLKTNKYYIDNPVSLSYFKTATFDCNCTLILSTVIVIMLLVFTAFQSRRLQYIQLSLIHISADVLSVRHLRLCGNSGIPGSGPACLSLCLPARALLS